MSDFKISADYVEYSDIVEEVKIKLSDMVYILIKPLEKTTIENNITTKELLLECQFIDDNNAYEYTWIMNRMELKQFIQLFQDLQSQLQARLNNNSGNTGCTRSIVYK